MIHEIIPVTGRRLRAALLPTIAMAGFALAGTFFFAAPGAVAAQEYLYVASQEAVTVAVIDMATNELVETVDLKALGFSPTAKAHHTAV